MIQRRRSLLSGNVAIVVDHPHRLTHGADPNADVSVLGQVVFIPPASSLENGPGKEDGIATKWRHARAGVVMQAALEPEEVLEHVECRVPVELVLHQLKPALHA